MLWGVGMRHPSEVGAIVDRLNAAGNPTIDISGIEAAQVRLGPLFSHRMTSVRDTSLHVRGVWLQCS